VRAFFGESDIYVLTPHLSYGFWYIMVALFGQKVISHVLMELSAAMLAQRQFAFERGVLRISPGGQNHVLVPGPQSHQMLSADELLLFSPAVRYLGVSGVSAAIVYAGLPHWVWRAGVTMGLMDVAED